VKFISSMKGLRHQAFANVSIVIPLDEAAMHLRGLQVRSSGHGM
jgi:hypothetical protein